MAITPKSIKILWSNAAGRCSFTDCKERLTVEQSSHLATYTLGEMAHIKGDKAGSNRYDKDQTSLQRNGYENLILLCPAHHTLIDKPENENIYRVELLLRMKIVHENKISMRLEAEKITNADELKNRISIYLAENQQAWMQYGPLSDAAQKNPQSAEIHAIWLSERLSTIVPNNRIIVGLLKANRNLFSISEQLIVSQFVTHERSYEMWVRDVAPYQAVLRFPIDFHRLITGT